MAAQWFTFLASVVLISLSGVMAPGPITAVTLACGAKNRHAGIWVALGHGIVEFPLILVLFILAGVGKMMQTSGFKISVGLAGGVVLIGLGLLTVKSLLATVKTQETENNTKKQQPLWSGMMLTGGNPYFLIWWATVGLGMLATAKGMGWVAVAIFAIVHWICDLVWYEILSLASFGGSALLGAKVQRGITAICGLAMTGYGMWFMFDAIQLLHRQ